MTTTAQSRPPRTSRSRGPRADAQTRDYFELAQRVKDAGLMGRNVRSYVVRTAVLALEIEQLSGKEGLELSKRRRGGE